MLRRRTPLDNHHLVKSDSETESDDLSKHCNARISVIKKSGKRIPRESNKGKRNKGKGNGERCGSAKAFKGDSDVVMKMAKDYQEKMKQLPIPMTRRKEAFVGFLTWQALANSMKQFYGQPLHYLTIVLVNKWDESRIGTTESEKPMYDIMHPRIAESTIWGAEEVHRICTSHVHLAKLWLSDPHYSAFVGEVIPSSKLAS